MLHAVHLAVMTKELLRTIRLRNEQRVKEIERLDAEIKAQNEALGKKSRATSPADVESTAKDTLRRGIHNKVRDEHCLFSGRIDFARLVLRPCLCLFCDHVLRRRS